MGFAACCREDPGGLSLRVRLTPRGGADRIDGPGAAGGEPALLVRVRAAPEDGEANAALERVIARAFGVPASAVSVVAGHKARIKRVRIAGQAAALLDLGRSLWP